VAQTNTLVRESVSYIGEEVTLGTLPAIAGLNSMQGVVLPIDALMVDGITTEMLANPDEGSRRYTRQDYTLGLQRGSRFSLKTQVKPILASDILEAGATVNTAITHRVLYRHAFGAEHAAAGQSVTAGTSGTSFTVTSAADMVVGTWILVSSDGTATPEACRIDDISTNTLTVSPSLSFTPSNASEVRQLYTYVPAEAHSRTFSFQRAFVGDSTAQYELRGCYGDPKIAWEYGQVPSLTIDGTATVYQRGALSLGTTAATETMGAPAVFAPCVYLVPKSSGSRGSIVRAVRYACESISLEYGNAWELVREGCAAGTIAAVVATAGRPGIKATIRARFDGAASGPSDGFDARTQYEVVLVWRMVGTGYTGASAARFMVLDLPNCRVAADPKPVMIGARLGHEFVLEAHEDDCIATAAGTPIIGANTDFQYAPMRLALG